MWVERSFESRINKANVRICVDDKFCVKTIQNGRHAILLHNSRGFARTNFL